ncbi:MAG: hypothetical protein JWQ43_2179 [Glaciihabitans sp.]|nr:hypothetical protein [Glaciihabitans sp.]
MSGESASGQARAEVREMIRHWRDVPAFVRDRHLTIVASNDLARAISPSFVEGINMVRFTFLNDIPGNDRECWGDAAQQVAAILRDSLDQHSEDGAFREIVGQLSAESRRFAEAWADEVPTEMSGSARFQHDFVGQLTLVYQQLWIAEDHDDALVVWRAADPETRQALTRLRESSGSGPAG